MEFSIFFATYTPHIFKFFLSIIGIGFGIDVANHLQKSNEYTADAYTSKYGYKNEGRSFLKKLLEHERKMICDEMRIPRGNSCDSYIRSQHTWSVHPATEDRIEKLAKQLNVIKFVKMKDNKILAKIYDKLISLIKKYRME